jgi:hypothetical protein
MLKEVMAAVHALRNLPPVYRDLAIKEATRRKRRRRKPAPKKKVVKKVAKKRVGKPSPKSGPKPRKEKIAKLRRLRKEPEQSSFAD